LPRNCFIKEEREEQKWDLPMALKKEENAAGGEGERARLLYSLRERERTPEKRDAEMEKLFVAENITTARCTHAASAPVKEFCMYGVPPT
jgi:hypothetical protein